MAGPQNKYHAAHKHERWYKDMRNANKRRWLDSLSPERRRAYYQPQDLKKKYGMTVAQYEAMKEAQGGKCAICREVPIRSTTREGFCVDHDHATGKVRGLLCWLCNHAIERVEKQSDWGQRALKYLEGVK